MDLPSAAAAALAAAVEHDDALAGAHAGPAPTGRLLALPCADDEGGAFEVLDVDALLPGEQAHELKVRLGVIVDARLCLLCTARARRRA